MEQWRASETPCLAAAFTASRDAKRRSAVVVHHFRGGWTAWKPCDFVAEFAISLSHLTNGGERGLGGGEDPADGRQAGRGPRRVAPSPALGHFLSELRLRGVDVEFTQPTDP